MSLQKFLKQLAGSTNINAGDTAEPPGGDGNGYLHDTLGKLSGSIPGGLAGGAAAGGIMALLMDNKSARKLAGKAATFGGAAVLGGLAYRAYQQWQKTGAVDAVSQASASQSAPRPQEAIESPPHQQPASDLTIIKAMISAANADGFIDAREQQHIFKAVDAMALSNELKATIFDYFRQPVTVEALAQDVTTLEQKSEVYLAACMVSSIDHPAERAYLDALGTALQLPRGLTQQLDAQAQQAVIGR
jgi:uncharacterized membrane protein YebE (DUF533 family)